MNNKICQWIFCTIRALKFTHSKISLKFESKYISTYTEVIPWWNGIIISFRRAICIFWQVAESDFFCSNVAKDTSYSQLKYPYIVKTLCENVNFGFGIAESETHALMLFLSRQIVKNLNIMQMGLFCSVFILVLGTFL